MEKSQVIAEYEYTNCYGTLFVIIFLIVYYCYHNLFYGILKCTYTHFPNVIPFELFVDSVIVKYNKVWTVDLVDL